MSEKPILIDRPAFLEALVAVRKKSGLGKLDAWVRATEKNVFTAIGQKKFEIDHLVQASVRVWTDKGIGIATTSDISETGLLAAAESARELGLITDPSDYEYCPDITGPAVDECTAVEPATGPEQMRDLLQSAVDTAAARHPEVSLPYCETSQSVLQRLYATSAGNHHYAAGMLGRAYFQARTEARDQIPRTGFRQRFVRNWQTIDHSALAVEAVDYAIFRSRHRKIETGTYPVVFSPQAFLAMLGGFSSMFSGQAVAENQSLLSKDQTGKQIASPLLSLSDAPLDPRNPAPVFFSGEGIPTHATSLITNGELHTFLHSRLSAKTLGGSNTWHGSFGAKPSCSPYFLAVAAGKGGSFRGTPYVYVDRVQALHAGISPRQGSFSLPIEGRFISNGDDVSIEAAVVAGDIRELLKEIAWIGQDVIAEDNGLSPEVGISGLKVTGGK